MGNVRGKSSNQIANQLIADGYNIFNPNIEPDIPRDWSRFAACKDVDPDIFFPEMGQGRPVDESIKEAKRICSTCPVESECLAVALMKRERNGVWGGTSHPERKNVWSKFHTWRMAENDHVYWANRTDAV